MIVRETLAPYRKKLDESAFNNQMKYIISKKDSGLPLFLVLACQELRVFGIFEKISQKLQEVFALTSTFLRIEAISSLIINPVTEHCFGADG